MRLWARVRRGIGLPIVLHDVPGSFQLCSRQQQISGVGHSEEVPGSAQESALVPARFLDIDIQGQLTHFLQGKHQRWEDSKEGVQELCRWEPLVGPALVPGPLANPFQSSR